MDRYKFGNKLCSLREANNLTQKELADELGVSDKAVSKWENGKSIPKFEVLEEISERFEVDIPELLCLQSKSKNFEIERLRLSVSAQKEKNEKIKNVILSIMIFVVTSTLILCAVLFLLYLITKNAAFLNHAKTFYSNLYLELGFGVAVIFIKTIILKAVFGVINLFKTPSDCVSCENRAYMPQLIIHHITPILAVIPVFIAANNGDDYLTMTIMYVIIITLITINLLTQSYSDSTVILTEKGFFKHNIEHGEFYSYSEITNLTTNIEEAENGLSSNYIVKFNIGKEKFKLSISDVQPAARYFGDKTTASANKISSKLKPWQYVAIGVSTIIMAFGAIMFWGTGNYSDNTVNYSAKSSTPSALTGDTSVLLYSDKIYAYSDNQSALNVFDNSGEFEYSLYAPPHNNGVSYFYIRDNCIYLQTPWQGLYKYDINGIYQGRAYTVYPDDDDDESVYLCISDSKDKLLKTIHLDSVYDIFSFDDSIIEYEIYDQKSYLISYNLISDKQSKTELVDSESEDRIKSLSNVSFTPYGESVFDNDKNEYSIFFGKLWKNDEVLFETPFFDWYKNTSSACWLTCAFGMAASIIQIDIYKKSNYKKSLKK